jgi:hypothetical protein
MTETIQGKEENVYSQTRRYEGEKVEQVFTSISVLCDLTYLTSHEVYFSVIICKPYNGIFFFVILIVMTSFINTLCRISLSDR